MKTSRRFGAVRSPRPNWQTHKYHRGHVFVVSGGRHNTGAARLAAHGAQRIGAGLVTMLSPVDAADIHAAHLTSIMLRIADNGAAIAEALSEKAQYKRVAVIGPAAGVGADTREKSIAAIGASAAAVVDADALTSFADDPSALFAALRPDDVITPHEGEFSRLFGDISADSRIAAARAAAVRAGAFAYSKVRIRLSPHQMGVLRSLSTHHPIWRPPGQGTCSPVLSPGSPLRARRVLKRRPPAPGFMAPPLSPWGRGL